MGEIAGQTLALHLIAGAQVVDAAIKEDPEHEAGAAIVEAEAQHLVLTRDGQKQEGYDAEYDDGQRAHAAVALADVLADHEPERAEESRTGDKRVDGAEEHVLRRKLRPEDLGRVIVLQDGGNVQEVEQKGRAGVQHGLAMGH